MSDERAQPVPLPPSLRRGVRWNPQVVGAHAVSAQRLILKHDAGGPFYEGTSVVVHDNGAAPHTLKKAIVRPAFVDWGTYIPDRPLRKKH